MLTLFTLPRAFIPPFDRIQHNAFASWSILSSKPDLILFGKETGTSAAAILYQARHIPDLKYNHLGTPLVNHLFRTATACTRTPYQGFVNADIILDPHLPALIDKIVRWRPRVLIVSRRWDLDVPNLQYFSRPGSFANLARQARTAGQLYSHHGMDVFIFPSGLFDNMPSFSVGWPGAKYDNWIVYSARRRGIPVVDITEAVTTIHQNHPSGGRHSPEKAQEHWISLDLLGGHGCCFDLLDATHIATHAGTIIRRPLHASDHRRRAFKFAQRVRYRFRSRLLGFNYAQANGNESD